MKKFYGFSLVEMTLSIALVGIGLVGMYFVFANTLTHSLVTDQTIIASNLARETLETIIAQRDCDESGCGYSSTLSDIQGGSFDANPVSDFSGYALDVNATEVDADDDDSTDDFLDASASSGYARITLKVTWNNGANHFTIKTLMTNYTTNYSD